MRGSMAASIAEGAATGANAAVAVAAAVGESAGASTSADSDERGERGERGVGCLLEMRLESRLERSLDRLEPSDTVRTSSVARWLARLLQPPASESVRGRDRELLPWEVIEWEEEARQDGSMRRHAADACGTSSSEIILSVGMIDVGRIADGALKGSGEPPFGLPPGVGVRLGLPDVPFGLKRRAVEAVVDGPPAAAGVPTSLAAATFESAIRCIRGRSSSKSRTCQKWDT